jgi:hypothetical protein
MSAEQDNDLRRITIDGKSVFVGGDADEQDVTDQLPGTQAAYEAIFAMLRRERIHPVHAMNALLNAWHALASATGQDVEGALDTMRRFHRAALIANADA